MVASFEGFNDDVVLACPLQKATDPLEKAVLDGRQLALKVNALFIWKRSTTCATPVFFPQ